MSISKILLTSVLFTSTMPTKKDWQDKIDAVVEQYHKAKHLPRKRKKQAVKQLNSDFQFYKSMQSFNPF